MTMMLTHSTFHLTESSLTTRTPAPYSPTRSAKFGGRKNSRGGDDPERSSATTGERMANNQMALAFSVMDIESGPADINPRGRVIKIGNEELATTSIRGQGLIRTVRWRIN